MSVTDDGQTPADSKYRAYGVRSRGNKNRMPLAKDYNTHKY